MGEHFSRLHNENDDDFLGHLRFGPGLASTCSMIYLSESVKRERERKSIYARAGITMLALFLTNVQLVVI